MVAAKVIITPTDTAYIAGHTQNRIFKGVHDDIFVKAFVAFDGSETLTLLTFDCIGLLYPELLEIRKSVKQKLPFYPVEHILMTSTHTHSGPDVVGLWGKDFLHSGVDTVYIKSLIEKATLSIVQAWHHKRPVKGAYSTSTHGEDWVFNIAETDELDRSLTVLRFRDKYNYNVATLTNFACHPTFLDAINDQVSSDYVGGYYKKMDAYQGGNNFFIQGSIGGWVQPEYEDKTSIQAFYRGKELAEKVISILQNSQPLNEIGIKIKTVQIKIPIDNQAFVQLSEIGVLPRKFTDSVLTEVAYFKIGNASFATHPGETVPALSLATKKLMKNEGPRFVIGLGMDALGYILKPAFFDPIQKIPHSQYLCSVSLGVKTEKYILDALTFLIQE